MSLQTLENIKIDSVTFSGVGSVHNPSDSSLTITSQKNISALNIESGSGGILIDSTKGEGNSGSVSGSIKLVSKADSSWLNTESDLILKTITSGNIDISSVEDLKLNGNTISIGNASSTTNLYGKFNFTGADSYITYSGSWSDGTYSPGSFANGGLSFDGGLGVGGNVIIAGDSSGKEGPILNVKQTDTSGDSVISLTQVNGMNAFFEFISKSTNKGSGVAPNSHDPDGAIVSSIKNRNIKLGKLSGYLKIVIKDQSTEDNKIEDGYYSIPFYELTERVGRNNRNNDDSDED